MIANARRLILLLCSLILVVFIGGSLYDAKLTAQDTSTNLYVIGTELMDTGAYLDAVDVLKKAAYLNPKDPYIYYDLGEAAYLAGNDALATQAWEVALKLDPEIGKLRLGLPVVRPKAPEVRSAVQNKLLESANKQWNRTWSPVGSKGSTTQANGPKPLDQELLSRGR